MSDKIRRIADYYGYEAQSRQPIEEMSELTKAINKLWRFEHGYSPTCSIYEENMEFYICREELVEEIADVEICMEYVKQLLNITAEEVNEAKKTKVERELNRIAGRELDMNWGAGE